MLFGSVVASVSDPGCSRWSCSSKAGRSVTRSGCHDFPRRGRLQGQRQDLPLVGDQTYGHRGQHLRGDVVQVGLVAPGQEHLGQPGPLGEPTTKKVVCNEFHFKNVQKIRLQITMSRIKANDKNTARRFFLSNGFGKFLVKSVFEPIYQAPVGGRKTRSGPR